MIMPIWKNFSRNKASTSKIKFLDHPIWEIQSGDELSKILDFWYFGVISVIATEYVWPILQMILKIIIIFNTFEGNSYSIAIKISVRNFHRPTSNCRWLLVKWKKVDVLIFKSKINLYPLRIHLISYYHNYRL